MKTDPMWLEPFTTRILAAAFELDSPARIRAFHDAAFVGQRYLAPFITKVAVDMLPEILVATTADPGATVVFQGRDGFAFGHVFAAFAPEFYASRCVPLYLSRRLVDSALCDLENHTNAVFPGIERYRHRLAGGGDSRGAWNRLTAYFLDHGVPIGAPGSVVHLVDTGLKGSIQEMLAAAYPQTNFVGHLAFHASTIADPHPGSKRGYVLHMDGANENDGDAIRGSLPTDRKLTFLHRTAILAVESLVQGSHCSPVGYLLDGRPHVLRARHDPHPLAHIDPSLIQAPYGDPTLREGVRSILSLAISRFASVVADRAAAASERSELVRDSAWYADLVRGSDEFVHQIRAWISRAQDCDPRLRTLLDTLRFSHQAGACR
ncbi:hypothetical protein [Nocardia cyriacigeorgica]|uniref:hypothetical protein n=1 Tax=Nocardia cyriacigeorgica TaxID=135487 RepID=UPI001893FE64|nr:hypothetical protein [Nocardia cyriacigeorgica]MBF6290196.1 hypothetical protein [Nocardia cyriacigeorgica]